MRSDVKIVIGFFLLVGLFLFVADSQQKNQNNLIENALPLDKGSFGYSCIQIDGITFSEVEGHDLLINLENNNTCQFKRQSLSSIMTAAQAEKVKINLDFFATDIEQNCDGLINSYSTFFISKDQKAYQCLQGSPI